MSLKRPKNIAGVIMVAIATFLSDNKTSFAGDSENTMEISRPEILLPPNSKALAWRYDARIAPLAGTNSSSVFELNTRELVEWRLDQLKKLGFNAIIINGYHMHLAYPEAWPKIVKYVKMTTSIAHDHGMKVIFHHDAPVIEYSSKGVDFLMKHPDWLARDIRYGKPNIHFCCVNNPHFREFYFERIENLVSETKIDAIQLDEISHIGKNFCGCDYCRKLFTMKTGLTLPKNNNSKVFFNMRDKVWIAWLKWRKRSLGDFWVSMREKLNLLNPNLSIMMYATHYGFTNHWAPNELGYDLVSMGRACDYLGTEIMSRNVYDSYRAVFAYRKAMAGLGDLRGTPIHAWLYHLDDPVYAYFGWAMNHMNRQTTIMSTIQGDDMTRYVKWPLRMRCANASSVSDVALVFSGSSRDFGQMLPHINDLFGISQSLTDAHIQHDILMEQDLLDGLKLSKYKLLMLTTLGNMSKKEARAVRQYVKSGGILFASGHTSLYDLDGVKRADFQLSDVMGVDLKSSKLIKAPTILRMIPDGKLVSIPYSSMRVSSRPETKTIAEIVDANGVAVAPEITSHPYGDGICFYSALPLGALNFQNEYGYGKKIDFLKCEPLYNLTIKLVKTMLNDDLDFKAIDIPEKVVAQVCEQNDNGKRALLINLLNATGTGSGLKKGDVVPAKSNWLERGDPFPELKKNIVFEIRVKSHISSAYIASPDYPEKRDVSIRKMADNHYRVSVDKHDLKAYAIVYINLN